MTTYKYGSTTVAITGGNLLVGAAVYPLHHITGIVPRKVVPAHRPLEMVPGIGAFLSSFVALGSLLVLVYGFDREIQPMVVYGLTFLIPSGLFLLFRIRAMVGATRPWPAFQVLELHTTGGRTAMLCSREGDKLITLGDALRDAMSDRDVTYEDEITVITNGVEVLATVTTV
ncbi:hypothetical protein [Antribacter gilvus]|uniref:hypothetical protein n=1 Tax=Antribacter gilvus TaxID=2304675 RepID=UPI000F77332C|nr:hypothetical protein [Antribacter gilvus]